MKNFKYAFINNIDFYPFFIWMSLAMFYPNISVLMSVIIYLLITVLLHVFIYRPIIKKKPEYSRKRHKLGVIAWLITLFGILITLAYISMYGFQSIFIWPSILVLVIVRDCFATDIGQV